MMGPGLTVLLGGGGHYAAPSSSSGEGGYSAEQMECCERLCEALGVDKGKAGAVHAALEEWHELAHMDE